jgi:hypothetical protein
LIKQDDVMLSAGSFSDKPQVGLITLYRETVISNAVGAGRYVQLINTHLLFNQKRGDIKLLQLAMLLARAAEVLPPEAQVGAGAGAGAEVVADVRAGTGAGVDADVGVEAETGAGVRMNSGTARSSSLANAAVLLCGDFNSTPNSAVLEFVANGQVVPCLLDCRGVSGQLVEFAGRLAPTLTPLQHQQHQQSYQRVPLKSHAVGCPSTMQLPPFFNSFCRPIGGSSAGTSFAGVSADAVAPTPGSACTTSLTPADTFLGVCADTSVRGAGNTHASPTTSSPAPVGVDIGVGELLEVIVAGYKGLAYGTKSWVVGETDKHWVLGNKKRFAKADCGKQWQPQRGCCEVTHPFTLTSMVPVLGPVQSPPTTWHFDFVGVVDYIFFTDGPLKLINRWRMRSAAALNKKGGIPNADDASDHQLIAARLAFSPSSEAPEPP